MSLVEALSDIFRRRPGVPPAVERLSGNPPAMAQLLLLFRLILVDGVVDDRELLAFEKICKREFGIEPDELQALHELLESPHGRAAETQLFFLLKTLDAADRSRLLGVMQELARANGHDTEQAFRMIAMTAQLLKTEISDA